MENSTKILLVRHLGRITSWLKGYVDSFFSRMSTVMDQADTVTAGLTELNETVTAAETVREDAEFQRLGDETLRRAHESTRVANEDRRLSNETARIEAENQRQANETRRQQVIDNLEGTIADKVDKDMFDTAISQAMKLLDDKVDNTTFSEAMTYGFGGIEALTEAVLETPLSLTVELGAPQPDGTAKARIIGIDSSRLDLITTSASQNRTVITNAHIRVKRHGDSEASTVSDTFRVQMSAALNSELQGQEGEIQIPLLDSPRLGLIAENIRCSFQKVSQTLTLTSAPEVTAKLVSTTRNDYSDADKAKLTRLLPNGQFGYTGLYSMDGKFYADPSYGNSGLIPVNRKFDLEFAANVGGSVASVVFFDGAKRFISAVQIPQTLAPQVLPAADIPADAVFFIISTATPARSYYRNGSTIEAREGAVSEAIQASVTTAVDATLIAEAEAAGIPFNRSTGFFELNGLTDIDAKQMRLILRNRQRTPANVFIALSQRDKLRTNLWESSPQSASDEQINYIGVFSGWIAAEVLNISDGFVTQFTTKINGRDTFKACRSLHTILGEFRFGNGATNANTFTGCVKLRSFRLREVNYDIDLHWSPDIDLETLQFMVDKAADTMTKTITLHPEAFARLTSDLAEAATAKQITFATTE